MTLAKIGMSLPRQRTVMALDDGGRGAAPLKRKG
jgi:hypothetical protein